jgi:MFS family permease
MGISALCVIAYYFLRPEDTEVMFGLQVLMAVTSAPTAALIFAMYADAADYGEWRRGRRCTGLVFSASSLAQKMGWTIGGTVAGILLAAFGYQANVEQAPEALTGIKLLMSVVPAIGAVLATVLLLFYRLDEKQMTQIEKDLTARREGRENAGMESIEKAERPSSLTGFAGVNVVVGVAGLGFVGWYGKTLYPETAPELRTMLVVVLGLGAVIAVALIVGAFGILRRKFWGRTLTIVYGIVSLILFLVTLPTQKLDQGVGLASVTVTLAYPVVLLVYVFSKPVAAYFDRLSLESWR